MIISLSGSEPRPVPRDDMAGAILADRATAVAAPDAVGGGRHGEPDHVDADRFTAAHWHLHHARAEGTAGERHGHPGSPRSDQPEPGATADGKGRGRGPERAEALAPPSRDIRGQPALVLLPAARHGAVPGPAHLAVAGRPGHRGPARRPVAEQREL